MIGHLSTMPFSSAGQHDTWLVVCWYFFDGQHLRQQQRSPYLSVYFRRVFCTIRWTSEDTLRLFGGLRHRDTAATGWSILQPFLRLVREHCECHFSGNFAKRGMFSSIAVLRVIWEMMMMILELYWLGSLHLQYINAAEILLH